MSEFDQYKEIESGGVKRNELPLSNIYSVRKGGFGQEKGLSTYLSTLTVDQLQQDVVFYETLSKEKNWPVSHIIQRELDDERVNAIVKKYVLGQGREVKYFPPIIVALLPRDTTGNFADTYDFTPDISKETKDLIIEKSVYRGNQAFIKMFEEKQNDSLVGGLYTFPTVSVFDHSILCWDLSKFYAVVIDGQHRLDALLRAKTDEPAYSKAVQDVAFIDVSHVVHAKRDKTPIEIFRTIFIDINTNAKSVGLVRRILMDDKDLGSLCVQSLVESITKNGTSKPQDKYIPSILIDWDGGSLKHELPYLTGVLTLYQMINDELVTDRLTSINDHRDQKKIQYFISLLNDTFFVDATIKSFGANSDITTLEDSFRAYLKEKETSREVFAEELQDEALDSILFNYDYRVLEVAQDNFEIFFLDSIVSVFASLRHYIEATEMLKELEAFDINSTLYKAMLISKSRLVASSNMKDVYLDARSKMTEKLNSNYYLLFTVVGQKAIFKCLFDRVWSNFKHGVTPDTVKKVFNDFFLEFNTAIDLLNANSFNLFGKEELTISTESEQFKKYDKTYYSFWEGILFEDKRIIYNSQGVRAFSDIIVFLLEIVKDHTAINKENVGSIQIRFAQQRTKRLLKKRFTMSEEEYDEVADLMINNKKLFLLDMVKGMKSKTEKKEEEKA